MPIYEFMCEKCPETKDELMSVREFKAFVPSCPNCDIPMVPKMSASGLKFKGSGFHINDYGKG